MGEAQVEEDVMGERVVVNPASAGSAEEGPARVVPLDYGHGNRAGDAWRRFRAAVRQRGAGALEFLGMVVALVGGVRQVAFALGLMFVAGGLADAISRGHDEAAISVGFGALLIGLVVPVPKRKG